MTHYVKRETWRKEPGFGWWPKDTAVSAPRFSSEKVAWSVRDDEGHVHGPFDTKAEAMEHATDFLEIPAEQVEVEAGGLTT